MLNRVNVRVKKNKVTALIGESGAGKSIFARAICALLPARIYIKSGGILFKGINVDFNRLKEFRGKEIFYSPQNAAASLNPVIRIGRQIREVSHISHPFLTEILEFLNIAEPSRLLKAYPFELSEGENQRALLAMALALKPRLLVLDEPTSAFDADSRQSFMKLIQDLQRKHSLSVLLISHDLSIVRHIAHYVYIIHKGEIIDSGKPAALVRNPGHFYTKEIVDLLDPGV